MNCTVLSLSIDSLEFKRMRVYLNEVNCYPGNFERMGAIRMLPLVGISRTRGHACKTRRCRRLFFSQSLVKLWNYFCQGAVELESLNILKAEFGSQFIMHLHPHPHSTDSIDTTLPQRSCQLTTHSHHGHSLFSSLMSSRGYKSLKTYSSSFKAVSSLLLSNS